jgi:hypothetical protein
MPTYSIMQRYIIEYKITYIQFFTANVQLLEWSFLCSCAGNVYSKVISRYFSLG